MIKKELEHKTLLDGYISKKLTPKEVSDKLNLSYRQAKRVLKRYLAYGEQGLIHKYRGRVSPNSHYKGYKEQV